MSEKPKVVNTEWIGGELMRWVAGLLLVGMVAGMASAQARQATEQEASEAQGRMLKRVTDAVNGYAARVRVGRDIVDYCLIKMNYAEPHPGDGSVPYGVNYHNIDTQTLTMVVDEREEYERVYLELCVADAKNTLKSAETK